MTVEDNKISIIEGPPPDFELLDDEASINGLIEGPEPSGVAVTYLKAANPEALVERCRRAWKKKEVINFDYPTLESSGLKREVVPIVAAGVRDNEGEKELVLWIIPPEDMIFLEGGDDEDDDEEE